MVQDAQDFESAFRNGDNPRWISFVGQSGTGKTFLSDQLVKRARTVPALNKHKSLKSPVMKVFWPKLLSQLRDQEYWHVKDLSDAHFVLLDEIAVEHDPSGFGRDKLAEILSVRVNKWTILTSNLTLEKLAAIDARIPSRMIRGGSVVVECDTMDFNLR